MGRSHATPGFTNRLKPSKLLGCLSRRVTSAPASGGTAFSFPGFVRRFISPNPTTAVWALQAECIPLGVSPAKVAVPLLSSLPSRSVDAIPAVPFGLLPVVGGDRAVL